MLNFFMRKREPTSQEAIQRIAETEDTLQKKLTFLERKVQDCIRVAKTNGTSNKGPAIKALKRKKRLEKQMDTVYGALTNLEAQREALEGASLNGEVIRTMKLGAAALNHGLKRAGGVDKIFEIIDEVSDGVEANSEISDSLSSPISMGDFVDEDELMRELESLIDYTTEPLPVIPQEILPEEPKSLPFPQLSEERRLAEWAS